MVTSKGEERGGYSYCPENCGGKRSCSHRGKQSVRRCGQRRGKKKYMAGVQIQDIANKDDGYVLQLVSKTIPQKLLVYMCFMDK